MRYTKPKILRTIKAVCLIEEINQSSSATYKYCDIYLDAAVPFPVFCTLAAYNADE